MGRAALYACALIAVACGAPSRGPGYARAFAQGEEAESAGHYEEAADRYEQASTSARAPRERDYARHAAALMYARAGDRSKAWTILQALAQEGSPEEAALAADEAARMRIDGGEEEAGWADLRAALLRFPNAGVARSALHRLLSHEDETKGPRATLALLETLRGPLDGTLRGSEVAYEIALRLERLDQTAEARDAFAEVARRWPYPRGPLFDDALFHASLLDEKLGRYGAAIDDLRRMLAVRESSWIAGSYERPRFDVAKMRIADLYATRMHDDVGAARELHELYADFETSLLRDDALWKEAAIWDRRGERARACAALEVLVHDFSDSRYVPCAAERCPNAARPAASHAPKTCPRYVLGASSEP